MEKNATFSPLEVMPISLFTYVESSIAVQQSSLSYINEYSQFLLDQWYSLMLRLDDVARKTEPLECSTALSRLLQEYGRDFVPLDGHSSLLYHEQQGTTPYTLLLWSQAGRDAGKTHQWSALAMRLIALKSYQEILGTQGDRKRRTLPISIKWIIDTGGDHNTNIFTQFLSLEAQACLFDLADASAFPALSLGTKGLLRVALAVHTQQEPTLYGSIFPDAAWILTWTLQSIKDRREDVLLDGFYDMLVPPDDDEVALLLNAQAMRQHIEQKGQSVNGLLEGLQGNQLLYAAQFVPSCSITSIHTASAHRDGDGLLPSEARAQLDFLLLPDQSPDALFAQLQLHLLTHELQNVQAELLVSTPPRHTPLHHSFVQTIRAATGRVTETPSLASEALTLIPYATESMLYSSSLLVSTLPTIFSQFGPLIGSPDRARSTETERIILAHLAHTIALLEEFPDAIDTTR